MHLVGIINKPSFGKPTFRLLVALIRSTVAFSFFQPVILSGPRRLLLLKSRAFVFTNALSSRLPCWLFARELTVRSPCRPFIRHHLWSASHTRRCSVRSLDQDQLSRASGHSVTRIAHVTMQRASTSRSYHVVVGALQGLRRIAVIVIIVFFIRSRYKSSNEYRRPSACPRHHVP